MNTNTIISITALVAIYGVLFYLWYAVKTRRGIGAWLQKQATQRDLRVIETVGISFRTSLLLVEARGQPVLITVSPNGVQMLHLKESDSKNTTSFAATETLKPS